MKIKSAEFLTSVASKEKFINSNLFEFAFVGRSNCGKSSLINALVNQKKLAKTSSTPGLTKLVNYFLINAKVKDFNADKNIEINSQDEAYPCFFVDLPGYGFSRAGKVHHELWSNLIEDYFRYSQNLKCVFVLMDIRHEPNSLDEQMLLYLYSNNIPFKVIATKADKISKSKINENVNLMAKKLKITANNIIAVSSENKYNLNLILNYFNNFFEINN